MLDQIFEAWGEDAVDFWRGLAELKKQADVAAVEAPRYRLEVSVDGHWKLAGYFVSYPFARRCGKVSGRKFRILQGGDVIVESQT